MSVGDRLAPRAGGCHLPCPRLPIVGSEQHHGSQRGSSSPGQGQESQLPLQPWADRADLVAPGSLSCRADMGPGVGTRMGSWRCTQGQSWTVPLLNFSFAKGSGSHSRPGPHDSPCPFASPQAAHRPHGSSSALRQSARELCLSWCHQRDLCCTQWCGVKRCPGTREAAPCCPPLCAGQAGVPGRGLPLG